MEKQIRKIKLFYSGELILIAVVFLTLGILELLRVVTISDNVQLIFKIVTLIGATWIITDFIWILKSPKRRAKNCLMDKIMLLPLAVYLYAFDIVGFVWPRPYEYYQIGIPLAFFYIACAYIFQGIYHYYHPIPMIIEAIEEAQKELEEKGNPEVVNEEVQEPAEDSNSEQN